MQTFKSKSKDCNSGASLGWNNLETNYLKAQYYKILARACDVPVDRRSGGRLAMTFVATKNDIIIIIIIFFFLFPLSTFLIEEALGSKNLYRES